MQLTFPSQVNTVSVRNVSRTVQSLLLYRQQSSIAEIDIAAELLETQAIYVKSVGENRSTTVRQMRRFQLKML